MYEGSNHAKIYLHGLGRQDAVKGGDSTQGYCGEANAKLIAAAPDLLEALAFMLSVFNETYPDVADDEEDREAWAKARAAIRKATGE